MDPTLAEIYGTNQPSEADIEKLAAAELAEELSENEEANIDGMSDDDVEALAAQVLAAESDEEEQEEGETDEVDQESMEKISEADYLGRVMAHSYVNELRSIEKTAMTQEELSKMTPEKLKKMQKGRIKSVSKAHRMALREKKIRDIPGKIEAFGRKATEPIGRAAKTLAGSEEVGLLRKRLGQVGGAIRRGAGHVGAHLSKHQGKYGLGGAALALGGGAYAAKKYMDKKSSALDTLAERRAIEILEANGIDPETLQPAQEWEKVSSADVLNSAVDSRAWEILGQFGFTPSEE